MDSGPFSKAVAGRSFFIPRMFSRLRKQTLFDEFELYLPTLAEDVCHGSSLPDCSAHTPGIYFFPDRKIHGDLIPTLYIGLALSLTKKILF